ncbi:Fanconi anemia group E protein isoform X2 [Centropristis striata]|uniref:Fanconi anemia group E protein isoform X2 n=1 Tax=Centropristis striata TaxID=184440 RepID=UPI0027E085B9|nr:Fanconi anemia group E protein isoform X2 [Centropristis striata]
MDARVFLGRFEGRSRLLVRSLLYGASGASRALRVYRRQQRAGPDALPDLLETLTRDQVGCPGSAAPLTVQPLVCLFPALFQQNLLSLVHLVHPALPRPSVLRLLRCLSRDPGPSPWVSALVRQLGRHVGPWSEEPLCSALCSQRLTELSRRSAGSVGTGGWATCFSDPTVESGSQRASGSSELGSQRKRKGSFVSLDSDSEPTGQQSKRKKMDVCGGECLNSGEQTAAPAEDLQLAADAPCDVLPEHVKVSVLQIKELLESQMEMDQSSMELFKVLNDCNPNQVEVVCSMLSLPDLPEQTLPKLCSSILAPTPDFSFSTAATLTRSLLLQKVLSLSEPASRCLVTAVTSLCSRYPRPMFQALIGPVLEEKNICNPQAELLNRLVESCLDSHYRLLVLQMTFKVAWSEAVLSIIHSLLDSKVKAEHKLSLHGCLELNETFLKKSLQAALKRIAHM